MMPLMQKARLGRPLGLMPCIDMHGHIGRYLSPIPDFRAASLVRSMDKAGIRKTMVSHINCMNFDARWGNDVVAKEMRTHPGRIEGYATVWPDSPKNVLNEIKRCLKLGFGGIKLYNACGIRYNDLVYVSAWEIANGRHLPVLMHTWGDEPTLGDVRAMAEKYPGAVLLAGHSGSNAVEKYIALAKEFPNVYLELCFSMGPRGLVERFVRNVGAEKIVFGSDALFYSLHHQVGKVVGAKISEHEKKLILGQNAARILAARQLGKA